MTGTTEQFDASDSDTLTDEEKAGLAELREEERLIAEGKLSGDEENRERLQDEIGSEDGTEPEGDGEIDNPPPAAEDAAPPAADAADDLEDIPFPEIRAEQYTKADADRRTAIEAERDALKAKFDEGEIAKNDFAAADKALEAEDRALDKKADRWNDAIEIVNDHWDRSVNKWYKRHPEFHGNQAAIDKFDETVQAFTASSLSSGLTPMQTLNQALAIFNTQNPGLLVAAPPKKADPAPKNEHPADKLRREEKREPLPGLARMPAAATIDAGDGKFAHLDRLMDDPIAHEAAMERLSDDDRDEYLRSR